MAGEPATTRQKTASLLKDMQGSFKVRAAQDVLALLAWTRSQSNLWSRSKKAFKLLETAGLAPPSGSCALGAAGAASAGLRESSAPAPASSAQQQPQHPGLPKLPQPRHCRAQLRHGFSNVMCSDFLLLLEGTHTETEVLQNPPAASVSHVQRVNPKDGW